MAEEKKDAPSVDVKVPDSVRNLLDEFKNAVESKNNDTIEKMNQRFDQMAFEAKKSRERQANGERELSDHDRAFKTFLRSGADAIEKEQREMKVYDPESREQKALVTYNNVSAGYLVAPPGYSTELNRQVVEMTPALGLVRTVSGGSPSFIFPKRNVSGSVGKTGEGADYNEFISQYGQDEIVAHKHTALTPVSNEQLEDAAFNMEQEILFDQSEQFAFDIGRQIIKGSGIEEAFGMINNVSEVTASAGALGFDDLFDLAYTPKTAYLRGGAGSNDGVGWMANRQTFKVIRQLATTANADNFLWQPGFGGEPETLLGYPIYEAPDLVAPAANGNFVATNVPLLFGNFRRGYTFYRRTGTRVFRNPYRLGNKGIWEISTEERFGGKVTRDEAIVQIRFT